MENEKRAELVSFLKAVPSVEFCCVYGSTLHPNNKDKSAMVDYILGVSDPLQWHSQNLKMNADHYASWLRLLGGAKLITQIADEIGVGVHFNPFVTWDDKMLKYGVVGMHDLVQDMLNWERFYLSGRLQKPCHNFSKGTRKSDLAITLINQQCIKSTTVRGTKDISKVVKGVGTTKNRCHG
ncbi:hypothetical protein Pint_11844 [Pistacia integerrima]|uniref:Uncharacterized protein n=1 Tax=Pistacia integerrima TaxID=434235 RepID=A0ACC0XI56_9ROSI|nr:hypothetical protein Pint_11844 [Pistacia integerrima]